MEFGDQVLKPSNRKELFTFFEEMKSNFKKSCNIIKPSVDQVEKLSEVEQHQPEINISYQCEHTKSHYAWQAWGTDGRAPTCSRFQETKKQQETKKNMQNSG